MNQEDNSASAMPRTERQILPHDAKELKKVSDFVAEKGGELQKVSVKVDNMGSLGLFWDSKAPQKSPWYHFCSLKVSNKSNIQEEIRKYQDFYKELGDAVRNISNADEGMNAFEIIADLSEKLSELSKAAEDGEESTSSSTVYNLHRSFIKKHETLEYMIKRVECVALKDGLKKATDGWQKSIQAMNELENKFTQAEKNYENRHEEISLRCNTVMTQNEQLLEQQKDLIQNNRRMEQQLDILLEENSSIENRHKEISLRCDTVMTQNEQLLEQQKGSIENSKRMEQQLGTLLEENASIKNLLTKYFESVVIQD